MRPVKSKSLKVISAVRQTGRTSNRVSLRLSKMSVRRLSLVVQGRYTGYLGVVLLILLLAAGCRQPEVDADRPAVPADEAISETELDAQLEINRTALLEGPSEQIRVKAAAVMLLSEEPLARNILLEALSRPENSDARQAICEALSQSRAVRRAVRQKSDFVQPLLDILATEDFTGAKLAAEATLIFEYDQISKPLEEMASDSSLPVRARLNAMYALRLQPDMRAIFRLIKLLDDSDPQVAAEAERTVRSLGIPVGKDAETRRQIIDELQRKGKDTFLRDWLIRQEARVREMETELDLWRNLYLGALGKIYDGISDDAARGKFLAVHLVDSKMPVRLWALEKVSQWRVGTKSKLPAWLGPVLVSLVSDQSRDVRLRTAKLLSLMGELDSAQRLLEQLKVEKDDEVKTELFVALGGACYYAFLPNSGIKIPPEVRKQTLELSVEYLSEQDPKKAQKGAEVMKKLLEQDGLAAGEVDRYLGLLVERYNQPQGKAGGTLRGELLRAMAGLCAQSVYRAESIRRFAPLFEEAVNDETDLVREAAVDGLIHIDKTAALKRFRKVLVNDSSVIIRKKLIELAGEVGGQEDLAWLVEKIGATANSEPAWQAMRRIFNRPGCDAAVLSDWIARFDSQSIRARLTDEQLISFLEIAERKAVSENNPEMLKDIRERLAGLYRENGEFERAAEYLGMLREVAGTEQERERFLGCLLDVYLRWLNVEAAVRLVSNRLLAKDLEPNDVIVRSIDNYLTDLDDRADPNALLKALSEIKTAGEARPIWDEQLRRWKADLAGRAGESGKPE